MPAYWSNKDERQYKHIVESYRGGPRAKEIAARTVNQQRRDEGRTKNKNKKSAKDMVDTHIRKMMSKI